MNEIVILGARRTPQGKLLGALSAVPAHELGATAIRAALADTGLAPELVDAVVFGHVIQSGCGQNPARQAAVAAGLPLDIPATTVNKVCLSGLDAIISAARMLRLGEADVVVAGGQESMSNAPFLSRELRGGRVYGATTFIDSMEWDALSDAFGGSSMGVLTEAQNDRLGITREQQDTVAARSQRLADAAWAEGIFDAEIAPVTVRGRRGDTVVGVDEGIRGDSTLAGLGALRPAFAPTGSITAGNASPISDGAAAVVLARRDWAAAHGVEFLAVLGEHAQVSGPDTTLNTQPANAIRAAAERAGTVVADLDFIEINEAFAAVAVESLRLLDYPLDNTNIHGGAIALGHPVGASGARIVVHAAHELARRGSGTAAVGICGGGGQGDALILHR